MTGGWVWLNGALVPASAARLDPSDRGFTLGDGLFETIRASGGTPCRLDRHFARLRAGAAVLGIPLTWSDTDLAAAMAAVLGAEGRAEAAIRLTLSRGPAPRGLLPPEAPRPTVLMTAGPLPGPLPPARVVVARATCRNERSPLARLKSLNYLDSIIARSEAAARGADDALLLNTQGRLAEAAAACLFLVIDGATHTPPVAEGALPGIARAVLLEAGLAVEASLDPARRATAGFLANSLGVRAIAAIDDVALDPGHPAIAQARAAVLDDGTATTAADTSSRR